MDSLVTFCFDFGNTRLKLGIFRGEQLERVIVLENDEVATVNQLIDDYHPQRSILSSVVDHNLLLEDLLREKTHFHKLNQKHNKLLSTFD